MEYYSKYVSNTIAASGNQHPRDFSMMEHVTTRIFYRAAVGGRRDYSLLFSNINDSTFDNGAEGYKNRVYDAWTIHSLKVGVCKNGCFDGTFVSEEHHVPFLEEKLGEMIPVTFSGSASKRVA
ncbi:MAG: hypothetical protein IKZ03_06790, partial [Clostridia bacterium]|nr:hypothetical protein [Clostridia bacterium]